MGNNSIYFAFFADFIETSLIINRHFIWPIGCDPRNAISTVIFMPTVTVYTDSTSHAEYVVVASLKYTVIRYCAESFVCNPLLIEI